MGPGDRAGSASCLPKGSLPRGTDISNAILNKNVQNIAWDEERRLGQEESESFSREDMISQGFQGLEWVRRVVESIYMWGQLEQRLWGLKDIVPRGLR